MGNNKSSIKKNIHYIYVYMGEENNVPDITTQLLDYITPHIESLAKYGIYIEIFKISSHLLTNPKVSKLLNKNKISKLPALKVKINNKYTLFIGNVKIMEYYNNLLKNIQMLPPQTKNQMAPQRGQMTPPQRGQMPPPPQRGQMPQPQQMMPPQRGQIPQPPQMMPPQRGQIPQQRAQIPPPQMMPPPQRAQIPPPLDDNIEDIPIGEFKDLSSNYNNMVKFREDSKKYYKKAENRNITNNSSNSSHNNSSNSSHNHSNSSHSHSQKKINHKSSITAKDLQDSPFREGELDDLLENNISIDDDSNESLLSSLQLSQSSASNPRGGGFPNLGDDNDFDDNSDLMAAFLDKF